MYPVPSSLLLRRSFCHLVPFSLVVGGSAVISYLEWGVGGFEFVGGGGRWLFALLKCLPKEVEPRSILPLGSLHADPVCWHSGF